MMDSLYGMRLLQMPSLVSNSLATYLTQAEFQRISVSAIDLTMIEVTN